jgi:membrane-bound serine protease (ClpP class)
MAGPVGGAIGRAATEVIDVVEVNGLIDERLVEFVLDVVETTDAGLVVLQVDSRGAVDGAVDRLIDGIADAERPVVVWVGPAPAVAQGGALQVMLSATIRSAAPEARLGLAVPTVAGGADDRSAVSERFPQLTDALLWSHVEVSEPIEDVVDVVSPSIGQLIVGLDGTEVAVGDTSVVLETASTELEDGLEVTRPAAEVRFIKPGIVDRTLRIALQPETAFLLLVMGLALVVFEFFAAGPGVAAAGGVASILLAGYGLATLPVNWWAVALALVGIALYVFEAQRNALGFPALVGTGLLVSGGLFLNAGGPQIEVTWWAVALTVAATALFFSVALTTVARARFSTHTIGRAGLIGTRGTAESALDPEGVVVIDGSRWRARARRGAGLGSGDVIEVIGIDGVVLEVEPSPHSG